MKGGSSSWKKGNTWGIINNNWEKCSNYTIDEKNISTNVGLGLEEKGGINHNSWDDRKKK
jgi:hypothetical protein